MTIGSAKTRDSVRAEIFKTRTIKKVEIEFFGAQIEIRQMRLQDILQANDNPDRESAIIESLIKYAYVPGTDERVFEEGDAEAFKNMPFGADFIRVSKALEELTEVNFLDKKASSGDAPTST